MGSQRTEPPELDPFKTRHATPVVDELVTRSAKDGRPRYVISTDQVDLMGDIVVQDGLKPVSSRIPAQVRPLGPHA